ncbi:MAG TPA: MMPL family transporter [Mycobacteriales bacterium]|jgi:RND superfamily putative drug exporter|nr:MMPL family transporter [Mycobacteriales bacterium]
MLVRISNLVVRRKLAILLVTLAALVVSGALGGGVAKRLSSGGFDDHGAESTKAEHALERFGGESNMLLLVRAKHGTVDSPDVAKAGRELTSRLNAETEVSFAASYWSLGSPPPLRSRTGDSALVLARITGDQDRVNKSAKELLPRYELSTETIEVRPGGLSAVYKDVNEIIEQDTKKADSVAIPVTLVLLILVFGSVVAALLPLAVGILAIVGTFLILRIVAGFTEVSIYSLSLTTAMGLGLAIDYSLFIVNRYREELRNGLSTDDAVRRSVVTAGRTVTFSALTVAASLGALLVFPLAFLRSFAYAGIAVVAMATVGAVVVLPALLAMLGPRVDKLVLWRHRPADVGEGMWHRIAVFVMRRPWPIALGVVALLLVLGAPFAGMKLGLPDDRVLPKDAPSRQVSDVLRRDYASREAAAANVVALRAGDPKTRTGEIVAYAKQLSALPGVARVDALTGSYAAGREVFPATPVSQRFYAPDATYLSVVPSIEPVSAQGEALVKALRTTPSPLGPVLVGGQSAQLVDSKASIGDNIPLAAALIALFTFVVLFLSFGSLLVPAKAVVLNLLSLTATFGAMVWIFQTGHLSGLLDFTATGSLTASMPILMFCIAFGLSMDYEVFLLSRIKEEHDAGADNATSVAVGLERTGRIVTAAAALIAIVFASFALTSGISFMILFGVGLTMAVVMDATLIRAALVPAFMKLAGEANWWAPRPLRRLYDRFGLPHDDARSARVAAGSPQDPAPPLEHV